MQTEAGETGRIRQVRKRKGVERKMLISENVCLKIDMDAIICDKTVHDNIFWDAQLVEMLCLKWLIEDRK